MADFSLQNIISKISEYDKLAKENANVEALVEYNMLGKKSETDANLPHEDVIGACATIKNYLNKVLKTT